MKYAFEDHASRGKGRTTAVCEAAKLIDATVVCANHDQARQVKGTYGVKTIALSENAHGKEGPYLFDHYAVDCMALSYEQQSCCS
jgi:hypothetical protein